MIDLNVEPDAVGHLEDNQVVLVDGLRYIAKWSPSKTVVYFLRQGTRSLYLHQSHSGAFAMMSPYDWMIAIKYRTYTHNGDVIEQELTQDDTKHSQEMD